MLNRLNQWKCVCRLLSAALMRCTSVPLTTECVEWLSALLRSPGRTVVLYRCPLCLSVLRVCGVAVCPAPLPGPDRGTVPVSPVSVCPRSVWSGCLPCSAPRAGPWYCTGVPCVCLSSECVEWLSALLRSPGRTVVLYRCLLCLSALRVCGVAVCPAPLPGPDRGTVPVSPVSVSVLRVCGVAVCPAPHPGPDRGAVPVSPVSVCLPSECVGVGCLPCSAPRAGRWCCTGAGGG